jgi:hypothetical protein
LRSRKAATSASRSAQIRLASDFPDAGVGAQRPHQIVDLAGAHPVQIGLHHHGEQRLVDPLAPLQQRGKNDPARSLGIRSSRSPAVVVRVRGREPLRWAVRASMRSCGADHSGELRLDQGLIDRGDRRPDSVVDIGGLECLQHLKQGRLVQGPSCAVSFRENHGLLRALSEPIRTTSCSMPVKAGSIAAQHPGAGGDRDDDAGLFAARLPVDGDGVGVHQLVGLPRESWSITSSSSVTTVGLLGGVKGGADALV